MPEFTEYPEGTPCWVDTMAADPAAARDFYGALFGWEFEIGPPETGNYAMCTVRGKPVAGLGGPPPEGVPTVWTTYLATNDVDRTVAAVKDAGGSVMMEPMDVMAAGRMAVVADPTGAVFGLWQAGDHKGSALANEPGSFTWNELITSDLAAAREFYRKVFGFGEEAMETGGGPEYYVFKVGDHEVAGAMPKPEMIPAEVPSFWNTYFSVADTDATLTRAKELGAEMLVEPVDSPFGRWVVLRDPQGASFCAIEPAKVTAQG